MQSRSQHASPRVIWRRTDCVMSANDMLIDKYELLVNRVAKSGELHLVIELYGMSSGVEGGREPCVAGREGTA